MFFICFISFTFCFVSICKNSGSFLSRSTVSSYFPITFSSSESQSIIGPSNFDVAPKRDVIENKENSKEGRNNIKAKEMIDLSLKVSLMLKEWNKQRRMFIEGKQVTYKESKTEDGEKYSYYAINGKEVFVVLLPVS